MIKTKIQLSGDDMAILTSHLKQSPLVLVRLKCQALLTAHEGLPKDAIARTTGKTVRTVERWLKDWSVRRTASIFTGHSDNENAAKLTKHQKAQIKAVLSSPPSEQGLPKEFWDVPQLKNYLQATFDVVYECDQSYHFLLKFSGLSFKYPDTFDLKRNEQLISERIQSIRSEIKPLKHRSDWEIFAVDEVKMQQDAIIRKAWLKKGKRTIVKVDRKKQSQSYIGFLNQKSFQCHLYEMEGRQNSEAVLTAMEQFLKLYPDKHIAIIWDNAPFHKSKQIKEQLKKGGLMERVHLIAIPPYAPDENPIEKVWGTTKQKISNIQQHTFEETKQAFADYVSSRTFEYSF
jgi:transposase